MKKSLIAVAVATALGAAAPVFSVPLDDNEGENLSLNIESILGTFSASEDYTASGGKDWQEGYIKAVINGNLPFSDGSIYGGLGFIAQTTSGDGDAAGLTTGSETEFSLDTAMIGWKAADESLDISVGRQYFQLGDGFLIAGDALNMGEGLEDAFGLNVNRGGAYYLAAQKNFSNTAIVRFDPEGALRGDLFWLKSSNPAQQDTTLAGLNLEWVSETGTLGASYLNVLDVEEGVGLGIYDNRKGMAVVSIRGQGNAGVENLLLSAEYVKESGGDNDIDIDASAWYAEAGWMFTDVPWTPNLNARYASFSGDDASTRDNEAFDPLFYGMTRGFGTWFQGEVAGNYAGIFNSGNNASKLELNLFPSESVLLGIQHWDFSPRDDADDLASKELDIFAMWTVNENVVFSPLIGWFTPTGEDIKAAQGNDNTNFYAQAMLMLFF